MVYPYLVHYPKDYSDLKYQRSKSGVYRIYPDKVKPFKVYCDMETDGGSWTVSITQSSGLCYCVFISVLMLANQLSRGVRILLSDLAMPYLCVCPKFIPGFTEA